jgi:hypothetical protein
MDGTIQSTVGTPRIHSELLKLGIDVKDKLLFQQSTASPNASL